MALGRRPVGENRELGRRFLEAGKLEARVKPGSLGLLIAQRLRVARLEAGAGRAPSRFVLHDDEAPGFAQADRGCKRGDAEKPVQRAARKRCPPKAPHIAPPFEKIVKACAKAFVEFRDDGFRAQGLGGHRASSLSPSLMSCEAAGFSPAVLSAA